MELTTEFQKIGTGSSKTYGAATGYLELWAKYNSQDIAENKSNVSVELRLVVSGGYIGNYQATYWSISGSLSNSGNLGSGEYRSQTLGSKTDYITHDNDGTKSISFTGEFNPTAWGQTLSVSASATLPTIPRYATVTTSVSNVKEHSVDISWTSDVNVDKIRYRIDSGEWVIVEDNVDKSSGTYQITGLDASTNYTIDFDYRRKDSQQWSFNAGYSSSETITTLDNVMYIKVNGVWKEGIN